VGLSGKGTLYSHTRVHAAPAVFRSEAPYRVCVVDLEEGVRIATRLVDGDEPPTMGGAVEMIVLRYDDGALFAARPVLEPMLEKGA
jgi:uncharacterized OB-fold protein